jgi:hypothetical protein
MNKKTRKNLVLAVLLSVVGGIFFTYFYSKSMVVVGIPNEEVVANEPRVESSTPYQDQMDRCPYDVSVGDRFICISNFAERTTVEADALAHKLITQAPVRLKEITTQNDGPMSWEYGGPDFLEHLPGIVKVAQKAKDQYINSVCTLASMKIFGSTGMDVEEEACRYYFTEQYLEVLKGLEGGLK